MKKNTLEKKFPESSDASKPSSLKAEPQLSSNEETDLTIELEMLDVDLQSDKFEGKLGEKNFHEILSKGNYKKLDFILSQRPDTAKHFQSPLCRDLFLNAFKDSFDQEKINYLLTKDQIFTKILISAEGRNIFKNTLLKSDFEIEKLDYLLKINPRFTELLKTSIGKLAFERQLNNDNFKAVKIKYLLEKNTDFGSLIKEANFYKNQEEVPLSLDKGEYEKLDFFLNYKPSSAKYFESEMCQKLFLEIFKSDNFDVHKIEYLLSKNFSLINVFQEPINKSIILKIFVNSFNDNNFDNTKLEYLSTIIPDLISIFEPVSKHIFNKQINDKNSDIKKIEYLLSKNPALAELITEEHFMSSLTFPDIEIERVEFLLSIKPHFGTAFKHLQVKDSFVRYASCLESKRAKFCEKIIKYLVGKNPSLAELISQEHFIKLLNYHIIPTERVDFLLSIKPHWGEIFKSPQVQKIFVSNAIMREFIITNVEYLLGKNPSLAELITEEHFTSSLTYPHIEIEKVEFLLSTKPNLVSAFKHPHVKDSFAKYISYSQSSRGELYKNIIEYLLKKNPELLDLLETPTGKKFFLSSFQDYDENLNQVLNEYKEKFFEFYRYLIHDELSHVSSPLKKIKYFVCEFLKGDNFREGENFLVILHQLALKGHLLSKLLMHRMKDNVIKLIENNDLYGLIQGRFLPNLAEVLDKTQKDKLIKVAIKNCSTVADFPSLIPDLVEKIEDYTFYAIESKNHKMALLLSRLVLFTPKTRGDLIIAKAPLELNKIISSESDIWNINISSKDNFLTKTYQLALNENSIAAEIINEIVGTFTQLANAGHIKSFFLMRLLPRLAEEISIIDKHKVIKAIIDSGDIKLAEELQSIFTPALWQEKKGQLADLIRYGVDTQKHEIALFLYHKIFADSMSLNMPAEAFNILVANTNSIIGKKIPGKNINYKDDQGLRLIDKFHLLYDYSKLDSSPGNLHIGTLVNTINSARLRGSVEPQNPLNINYDIDDFYLSTADRSVTPKVMKILLAKYPLIAESMKRELDTFKQQDFGDRMNWGWKKYEYCTIPDLVNQLSINRSFESFTGSVNCLDILATIIYVVRISNDEQMTKNLIDILCKMRPSEQYFIDLLHVVEDKLIEDNYEITREEAIEIFKEAYESLEKNSKRCAERNVELKFTSHFTKYQDLCASIIDTWIQQTIIGNVALEDWLHNTNLLNGWFNKALHDVSKGYRVSSGHYNFLKQKTIPEMMRLIISDDLPLEEPLLKWRDACELGSKVTLTILLDKLIVALEHPFEHEIEYFLQLDTNSSINFGQFKKVKSEVIEDYYKKILEKNPDGAEIGAAGLLI